MIASKLCYARGYPHPDPPQRILPMYKIDKNQNEVRPPAAGIHSHQRDVFIIPPPTRWWWRRGGIDPREHGYSGVDPPSGPIFSGTATRGPSLFGRMHDYIPRCA